MGMGQMFFRVFGDTLVKFTIFILLDFSRFSGPNGFTIIDKFPIPSGFVDFFGFGLVLLLLFLFNCSIFVFKSLILGLLNNDKNICTSGISK
jgi:hypothetical protein